MKIVIFSQKKSFKNVHYYTFYYTLSFNAGHYDKICFVVKEDLQNSHKGKSSPFNKYTWISLVWSIRHTAWSFLFLKMNVLASLHIIICYGPIHPIPFATLIYKLSMGLTSDVDIWHTATLSWRASLAALSTVHSKSVP